MKNGASVFVISNVLMLVFVTAVAAQQGQQVAPPLIGAPGSAGDSFSSDPHSLPGADGNSGSVVFPQGQ